MAIIKASRFHSVINFDKVVLKCAVHDHKAYQQITVYILIPVTRREKGYTRFVGKYETGRWKRFRPHKEYIFLVRIISRVDLAMPVCQSVFPLGER